MKKLFLTVYITYKNGYKSLESFDFASLMDLDAFFHFLKTNVRDKVIKDWYIVSSEYYETDK